MHGLNEWLEVALNFDIWCDTAFYFFYTTKIKLIKIINSSKKNMEKIVIINVKWYIFLSQFSYTMFLFLSFSIVYENWERKINRVWKLKK